MLPHGAKIAVGAESSDMGASSYMANSSEVGRKTWDAVTRRETADAILDAENPVQAFKDVAKRHRLQPYQLYAWVGQAAIARKRAQAVGSSRQPLIPAPVGRTSDSDGQLIDRLMRSLPADVLARVLADAIKGGHN